jgi:hypothetical protein
MFLIMKFVDLVEKIISRYTKLESLHSPTRDGIIMAFKSVTTTIDRSGTSGSQTSENIPLLLKTQFLDLK